MNFSILFSPVNIGTMEVKNRLIVPGMGSLLNNPDGTISQRYIDYFSARAKGGFGLLISEIAAVDPLGFSLPFQPGIYKDDFIPGLKKLVDEVHKHGAKIAVQLNHGGREAKSYLIEAQPVAPSPLPGPDNEIPRELTTEEVYDIIEKYGDAALRAKTAGFDAVEIHGAHSYIVAQFMSAYSNKRVDEFGGDFPSRMKFPVEIIKNIKKKAGNDFPVIFRISGNEKIGEGRTILESKLAAKMIEEAGADAIHVSVGNDYGVQWMIGPAAVPPGHIADDAAEIKKVVNIPVIAVGKIHEPYLAEFILETGMADLVAVGRAHLADPEFPNKAAEGRIDEIAPSISDVEGPQGGIAYDENDIGISSTINPFTGREGTLKLEKVEQPKKVVIVGAGPAGLEAAWIAAKRGHSVTVYEKQTLPGGQYRIAALTPHNQEFTKAIKYFMIMGKKYGVAYKFGVEVTAKLIENEKPDVVILATGAIPLVPNIEGIDNPKVVKAVDVIEGKVNVGKKVLVIGGDTVGVQTADLLGQRRHKVTIIEMNPRVADNEQPSIRYFLFKRLQDYKVTTLTNSEVKSIIDGGVVFDKDGAEQKLEGFDSIILACGSEPYNPLENLLKDKGMEVYVIGDAVEPRRAYHAIYEGAHLAVGI